MQAALRGDTTGAKGSRSVLQGPEVALEALEHAVTLHQESVLATLTDLRQSLMALQKLTMQHEGPI